MYKNSPSGTFGAHRAPLAHMDSRGRHLSEVVGKALCFVTLLCLETIRQLLSSDVVKFYHMGYLSHTTLPLPYPYCRVDIQERKAVSNVQLSLPVINKHCDCLYGTPCTNHPSWYARVCSDAVDTRDKLGSKSCMQWFAVDEPCYMGYAQE